MTLSSANQKRSKSSSGGQPIGKQILREIPLLLGRWTDQSDYHRVEESVFKLEVVCEEQMRKK